MEFLFIITCLLCIFTTFANLLRFKSKKALIKLPPGPLRLPIIGNLHNLCDQPHKSLAHLAEIHGPLMSLKLGQVTTIVASSPAVAKEILKKHDQLLSDRNLILSIQAHDHHKFGMSVLPVGPTWRNLRKVCNTYLFTARKLDSNQDIRRSKVKGLLESVQRNAYEGKAVDIGEAVFRTSLSALSSTLLSLDFEGVAEFKEAARGIVEDTGKPNLGDFFPALAAMDLQGIQRRLRSHVGKLLDLFGMVIDERLKERQSAENYVASDDMLDTLLDVMEKDGGEASMDLNLIKHLFLDLFVAGTDTTSSTVEWAMAELLRNPDVLTKAREEMDKVVGKGNHLQESDILKLPYLQAILKETFRLHPAAPLLLQRKARSDVEMCGFTIPEGAQILVNAWAIGRDPATWKNPNSYMPERFMGSEIDVRGHSFELIPFGGGRRICPGLPLAMRMLPMMLGSLVHSFDWKLKDGVAGESLDMEEKFGITLQKAKPLFVIPMFR